jgi:hypothetical protein
MKIDPSQYLRSQSLSQLSAGWAHLEPVCGMGGVQHDCPTASVQVRVQSLPHSAEGDHKRLALAGVDEAQ